MVLDLAQSVAEEPPHAMDRKVTRRPKWRRPIWLGIAGAGLFGLVLALFIGSRAGALVVAREGVEIAVARRETFQDYVPARGQVEPSQTFQLGAVAGGQVERVVALDGASVTAGQVLATLKNSQLMLEVTAREAEIAGRMGEVNSQQLELQANRLNREQEMAEAQYNLLKARRELGIRQQLHSKGFVADAALKTVADEETYYRARVAALKAGHAREDSFTRAQSAAIQQTSSRLSENLKAVQSSMQSLIVRAPVNGRLTAFNLQPGQMLKVGDPVGQIDSEGAYKLVADIDEYHLGRVTVGTPAAARLDGVSYPLAISRVLPQVSNGRFKVELAFDGRNPPKLRRGQTMDLKVTFGGAKPALVLNNGAWLEASGGAYAFVLDSGGRRADRRSITVGRRNPEQVEITSGLTAGERVLTSSYAGFEKYERIILKQGDAK